MCWGSPSTFQATSARFLCQSVEGYVKSTSGCAASLARVQISILGLCSLTNFCWSGEAAPSETQKISVRILHLIKAFIHPYLKSKKNTFWAHKASSKAYRLFLTK